nr:hypothetical protein [Acetivibrio clariflavus]
MSIVSQKVKEENRFSLTVDNFFKMFSVGYLLKKSNAYKDKGIPCLRYSKYCLNLFLQAKICL